MSTRPLLRALACAAVAFGVVTVPASVAAAADAPPVAPSVEVSENGRYLVQLAARSNVAAEAREMREDGVAVRRTFTHVVDAAAVTATPQEIAELADDPQVVAIEPDLPIHASGTQDGATWGLDRVDQRSLPLSGTFNYATDAAGVDVYVVDTGVRADHDELRGRVASGYTSLNDGNGTSDCNGHGTHVAGTAAGSGVGVAKAVRVIPVRVLDCQGSGTSSGLLAGLEWILDHHAAGTPAVANMSLGGTANRILDQATEKVIADGVTVVVAAGNSSADACTSSPARVPAALTVAATTKTDSQASFSNHGSCVDVYAPGTQIVSAYHSSPSTYAQMSGTSMAAPHVAGAAAVTLALQPSLSPAEVASRLSSDATVGAVLGATSGTPNRLLFLPGPVAPVDPAPSVVPVPAPEPEPEPVPTAEPDPVTQPEPDPTAEPDPITQPEPDPTAEPDPVTQPEPVVTKPGRAKEVTAKPGRRTAKLSWLRPVTDKSLTMQVVQVYLGKKQVAVLKVSAATTSLRVARLAPGRVYRFTVVEVNEAGRSRASRPSNKVVPRR